MSRERPDIWGVGHGKNWEKSTVGERRAFWEKSILGEEHSERGILGEEKKWEKSILTWEQASCLLEKGLGGLRGGEGNIL